MKCAILDDYQGCSLGFADWSSLEDVEVVPFTEHIDDIELLIQELATFDIIVAMRERTPFGLDVLSRLPQLKLLITTGMKNSAIDLDAAAAHGVIVCGTRSLPSPAPELAWSLLLALARNLVSENASLKSGGWQTSVGVGLEGKILGIIGLGKIGQRVARIAHAFGMTVIGWQPRLNDEAYKNANVVQASSLEELMEKSDFVSVHMVLVDATRGLIGVSALAKMKPTAFLINDSRGQLIDEPALIEALRSKRIAGAALDVFDCEPLGSDHPFRTLPNILATPHIGFVTEENYRIFYGDAVEDIKAWSGGAPMRQLSPGGNN